MYTLAGPEKSTGYGWRVGDESRLARHASRIARHVSRALVQKLKGSALVGAYLLNAKEKLILDKLIIRV